MQLIITATLYATRFIYGMADSAMKLTDEVPPLPGFFEIVCHGEAGAACPLLDEHTYVPRTAFELAQLIRSLPGYHGQPVRLLMCYAGAGENSLAQQLAWILGTTVIAADGEICAATLRPITGRGWLCFTSYW